MGWLAPRTLAVAALALFGVGLAERPQLSSSVLQSVEVRAHGHLQRQEGAANTTSPDCLCSFDIDRTLTGRQGDTQTCAKNEVVHGVPDTAYGGGTLTLSEVGQNLGKTFCRKCYIAFVSAGDASGDNSKERAKLLQLAKESGGTLIADWWVGPSAKGGRRRDCNADPKWYTSTLVLGCEDGSKQEALKGILAYLRQKKQVTIDPGRVYHYDDRTSNIRSFASTGFNSRMISCKHRERDIGRCGAQLGEIQESKKGRLECPPPSGCDPGGPVWNARAGDAPHTCGSRIEWVRNNEHKNDDEARKKIAGEFEAECGSCVEEDPDSGNTGDGGSNDNPDGDGSGSADGGDEGGKPEFEKVDGKKPRCEGDAAVDREDFGSPKELSPDACKSWCTEEEECECVTYEKSKRRCWLAKHCGRETWEDSADFAIYYKVVPGGGDPKYKTHLNTNAHPGHGGQDLGLARENTSPEQCMSWCSETAKCECATYHVEGQKCWLRANCDSDEWQRATGYNVFERLRDGPSPSPAPGPGPTPRPRPAGGPSGPEGCKTAKPKTELDQCWRAADWAKSTGVVKSPATYNGLTAASPFEDFQNFLHKDTDQQGCTVPACDPPPQQPEGVSVRITPALPSRGYGKVRVSLVRYAGRVPADSGDVKWSYNEKFQYRWDGNHLKSAIVEVTPGQPKTFNMDGTDVTVRLPRRDAGIVALFMADPQYSSGNGGRWNVLGVTQAVINGMSWELDYWSTVGDNWYDTSGKYHKAVFSGLTLNGSQVPFSATMGNHDYAIESLQSNGVKPNRYRDWDSFGFGHVQWYALDTVAAKDDEAKPFNWKYKPMNFVDRSNTFFYHSVGNVFVIGFSNNFGRKEQEPWFKEACQYAEKANPVLVLLLGHWDGNNHGCNGESTTPAVRDWLANVDGCRGKRIKGVEGHTHSNYVHKNNNFMVGGWGYDSGDGSFGLPFLDTRGGRVRFLWFILERRGHAHVDHWDTINCLAAKGINGCMDRPHEVWFDEAA